MPSRPYYHRYPADYRIATTHLTPGQHGAYALLLDECYLQPNGTIPNDPEWIIRRLGWSKTDFEDHIKPVLDEFFVECKNGSRFSQKRVQKELKKMKNFSEVQRDRANKRWKTKEKNYASRAGNAEAHAENMPLIPHTSEYNENSVRDIYTSTARAREGTPIDPAFYPDGKTRQHLALQCLTDEDIDAQTIVFSEHYAATGELRSDWQACFRKWCLNRYARKDREQQSESHVGGWLRAYETSRARDEAQGSGPQGDRNGVGTDE